MSRQNQVTGNGRLRVTTSVVMVFKERSRLQEMRGVLAALQPPLAQLVAIGEGESPISAVARLDPATARRQRQRAMARWLVPFGFLAGPDPLGHAASGDTESS